MKNFLLKVLSVLLLSSCFTKDIDKTQFEQAISFSSESSSYLFTDPVVYTGIDSVLALHRNERENISSIQLSYMSISLLSDSTFAFTDSLSLVAIGNGQEVLLASLGDIDSTKKTLVLVPSYSEAKDVFLAEDLSLEIRMYPALSYSTSFSLQGNGTLSILGK